MDLETAQITTTAKLPTLKQENRNSFKLAAKTTTNVDGTSTTLILGPVTTEEKVQKKNNMKARSMLLMALPNEHLMTFNQYKDAKTLFAAIQTRFSGFRRLNKPDLDTMSFDDLYNNFKIVEQEVKGTTSSSSSSNSQNMAFVSSPKSTNKVNTAYGVSTTNIQVSPASTQFSTTSAQVSTANLSDDTVYAFLASQPNGSQLVYEDLEQIHEDDIEEMDLKWQLALLSMRTRRGPRNQDSRNGNQDNSRRTVNMEETSSKAMVAIDGVGFDWSYMADDDKIRVLTDEVPTNMALMAFSNSEKLVWFKSELEKLKQEKESNQLKIENFDNASKSLDKLIGSQIRDKIIKGLGFISYNTVSPPPTGLFSPPNLDLSNSGLEEFQQPKFEGYGPKTGNNVSDYTSNEVKESPDDPMVEKLVSDDKLEKKTIFPTVDKIEFVRPKQQEKPVRKPANCNYHQRERVVSGNNYTRVNYNYSTKKAHPSAHKNMAPRAVLMKTGQRPLNTARPVNTAHPKTTVYSARPMPKAVNTARLNSAVVNVVRENQVNAVKASTYLSQWWLGSPKDFCEKKGIKREFSVARTPQQNGVAERRNRTLIEAARTMLADSKLPTTFWAEAVNTACYVQNRVLVVKPHNKTPYELFRGRTPALSFMRPFGCHVTILNTLDYLGKFDGKSDEGFFVGYSLNSKAFRVYNIRTRKVEENLHIRFLEDKPIIAGDGPKWLFDIDVLTKSMNYVPVVAGTNSNDSVGTEESVGTGHSSKETGSSQDYILMPLWKDGSLFDSSSKNASNDEPQPSSDAGKKDDEGVSQESGIDDQERPENSTQDVNTVGPSINTASTNVNTGSLNINIVSPTVTTAPLEATHADFFGDETKLDMSNITTTYLVPSTPNTRIHKDHSLDHVIGDVQSGVQTRRMTKNSNEQGFISAVYEGKTHEDLHTCLFAYFLSQVEPKK
ncbi:putative ribonuclease H-like domain-containing protein, partial [Tanacetum coccineum]